MVFSKSFLIETVPNRHDGKQLSAPEDDVIAAPKQDDVISAEEGDGNNLENDDVDASDDMDDGKGDDYQCSKHPRDCMYGRLLRQSQGLQ